MLKKLAWGVQYKSAGLTGCHPTTNPNLNMTDIWRVKRRVHADILVLLEMLTAVMRLYLSLIHTLSC